ncbi:MAG: hypothetical protein MH208_15515 [Marinobacter sp.]|nr:hypothetical protein [Marinobacter sp.]
MKSLLTAETIKDLHRNGQTSVEFSPQQTIITPEARDVAKKLGLKIIDIPVGQLPGKNSAAQAGTGPDSLQAIRQAVKAKLPAGHQNSGLLDQLIEKALKRTQAAKCRRPLL